MPAAKGENKLPIVVQTSAGGVVWRDGESGPEVAIVKIVPEMRWQLPKGIVDEGETPEQAALREVREEAGVEAELVAPIETIDYWFVASYHGPRSRFHKFVHFYLMKYRSGNVEDHDHEVDEARWVGIGAAIQMLEFKSEKDVVEKARGIIERP